ncbi:MAG TPA: LarC family nickel insertion protein [Thermoplasmata archaeon]|jgi:pyridinium-3,5-bisthiocarboxylic acid mononucleotide nickel chelatase|nr:LarC family nickel insertion protein [Thermoplasmata archaeon]
MTVAYFDCFSGIAGDMILGALLDLGVGETVLKKELKKLPLTGYNLSVKKIECNHITATDVTIEVTEDQHHRSLSEITDIINKSSLQPKVKKLSQNIFTNLGKAEAKIHNVDIEEVHFHEVGAVDSIIDIVGSVIGVTLLGIETIICSPLPLGHGFVSCEHGLLPLPAPATVELLRGIPVYSVDRDQETVTPTGAAVITTLASRFGDMPLMKINHIGYGSGKLPSTYPSLLRIFLGELEKKSSKKNIGKKREK